jgi:DmsE family decaheme c-type cytochrome
MNHPKALGRWTGSALGVFVALGCLAPLRAEEAITADKVGAETCLACHEDKAGFKDDIHAKAWPQAKGIGFTESCETCHGPGSLHAAAAGDKSNPGFSSILNPSKMDAAKAAESCLQCHQKGSVAHWDGGVHATNGVSCMDCHSAHGGNDKQLAKAGVTETCVKCHKDVKAEINRSSHHPIKEGKMDCASCHNPHGTLGEGLLTGGTVNETCYQCHAEKRGPFLWEHRPVTENCSVCHTPHGSNHGKLLTAKNPFLCQSCHSNSRHPGTIYAKDPNNSGKTSYTKLNNRALYKGCVNCHSNIHGSNHPSGKTLLR